MRVPKEVLALLDRSADALAKKVGWSRRALDNWMNANVPIKTAAVAKKIGVSRRTLYNWIEAGLLRAPDPERYRAVGIHYSFWFPEDVERARKLKGKLKAGRPKKKKSKKGRNRWPTKRTK
jgi:predicted DNA-binding transcriptional regulator AlpA